MHMQRGLQYLVCVCMSVLSVCQLVSSNLVSRAIMRPTRDTNGFSVTWTVNLKRRFLYKCFVKLLECYLLTAVKSAILSHLQFSIYLSVTRETIRVYFVYVCV